LAFIAKGFSSDMKISPNIVGYSFDVHQGPHVLEERNGWITFVILDLTLAVEFLSAYNEQLGYVVFSDYGEDVSYTDREAFREYIREYKEFIQ